MLKEHEMNCIQKHIEILSKWITPNTKAHWETILITVDLWHVLKKSLLILSFGELCQDLNFETSLHYFQKNKETLYGPRWVKYALKNLLVL